VNPAGPKTQTDSTLQICERRQKSNSRYLGPKGKGPRGGLGQSLKLKPVPRKTVSLTEGRVGGAELRQTD